MFFLANKYFTLLYIKCKSVFKSKHTDYFKITYARDQMILVQLIFNTNDWLTTLVL